MRRTTTSTVTILLVLALAASTSSAGSIRVAALTGQTAPGTEGDVRTTFIGTASSGNGSFRFAVLNEAGEVAFVGATGGTSGDRGIWSEGGGAGLRLVVRGQNSVPGALPAPGAGSDAYFGQFLDPVFNDAGHAAFYASLHGPGVDIDHSTGHDNAVGIWSEGGGDGLRLVARRRDPAVGMAPGVLYSGFTIAPVINGVGQTAFWGGVHGPGVDGSNDQAIWSEGAGGGLALLVREGDAAPGTESGVTFGSLNDPVLNDSGHAAFLAFLTGPGVTRANEAGIWSETGGAGLALIARAGDPAPGMPDGFTFGRFSTQSRPVVNHAGHIAFLGSVAGPGVDNTTDGTVWSNGGGAGLAAIAREGDPAPGADDGAVFHVIELPVLNGAGQTAFRGILRGPGVDASNLVGIWSEGRGEGLSLIARNGDPAPGVESDAVFVGFFQPVLNGAGQTAFRANSAVPGGSPRQGIWAEHPSGELVLVARVGDLLDVDDGTGSDLRQVVQLSLAGSPSSGGEDGRKRAINDRGQVAFRAAFTDRTAGMFVFEPDPTIEITSPAEGETIEADEVLIEGLARDDGEVVSVVVNGIDADLAPAGPVEVAFSATVPLAVGKNPIVATATDDDGNTWNVGIVIVGEAASQRLVCDANGDRAVDRFDVGAIFAARGSTATGPDDVRDSNGDGLITVNDGRLCVLRCTNPGCAPTAP